MKKILAMLLVMTMAFGLVACGNDKPDAPEKTDPPAVNVGSALELLQNVYNAYAEGEAPKVMGGSGDTVSFEGPGAMSDLEALNYQLLVPTEQMANVSEAASMMFAMNANSLTAGVFKVTGDKDAFITALKDAVLGNQWMCGFPDKLVIYTVGADYVVMAFGLAGVTDPMGDFLTPFTTALTAAYPSATQVVSQNLI